MTREVNMRGAGGTHEGHGHGGRVDGHMRELTWIHEGLMREHEWMPSRANVLHIYQMATYCGMMCQKGPHNT